METKKLWKYFIVIFIFFLIIFNWSKISWIFNYQAVSGFLSDLFEKEEKSVQEVETFTNGKEDGLEIPKIGVSAPLIFIESLDLKEIEKGLGFGVVHFPQSVLPGEFGQTIILGHSAPPNWPKIKYYHIFVGLDELAEGDEVYIFFNNKKYEYVVTGKYFLEKGEEIPNLLTRNTNVLYLISCWPPETGAQRIAVEANLKK